MAKLSDVNYSLQGEKHQESASSLSEHKIVSEIKAETEQQASTKWHIFKLVNNTRNGGVHVPGIDDAYNPNTKRVERMRLLAGIPSVWMSEQKELTPDYVRQNQRNLSFVRGTKILRIPDYDETALEFARRTKHNIGSPSKKTGSHFEFYEYDAAKEERESLEREDFELEMALLAKAAKPEDMKKHAAFLGLRLINDLGQPKTDEGVRLEYVRYAKRNPAYFKQTLGTQQVEIGWLVRKAIADNKIEIGREPGRIYWANGGGMISVMGNDKQPAEYLTDLAMTNSPEGVTFKEQLQRTAT